MCHLLMEPQDRNPQKAACRRHVASRLMSDGYVVTAVALTQSPSLTWMTESRNNGGAAVNAHNNAPICPRGRSFASIHRPFCSSSVVLTVTQALLLSFGCSCAPPPV